MKLTGGEIVTDALIRAGTSYVVGIPGHGCLGLVDAFRRRSEVLPMIQVRHEQSAAHLADAYFRVTGKPLAVFTSIGPGAINTAVGVATAFVDGSAMLLLTSNVHTYMAGRGVLQELDRLGWGDFPRILEPVVKQWWTVGQAQQLPRVMVQAFRTMLRGRPGPVLVDLPMDVQCDFANFTSFPGNIFSAAPGPAADSNAVAQAAELLLTAESPVIVAGGGVLAARAEAELLALAEHIGAPVVLTMMAKGAFDEAHPLFGTFVGANGTRVGNALTAEADVILAIGVRFADKATSSYRKGASFSVPPTKLIHVDICQQEIGRNYTAEIPIVADARCALQGLLEAVRAESRPKEWQASSRLQRLAMLRREWEASLAALRDGAAPPTISTVIHEVRAGLPDDAIVLTSSGHTQAQVFLEFPVRQPRTYLTAGGFSTMGWSLPAALGAQLSAPNRGVCAIVGDGDFLQTVQELATAVQYDLPILVVVCNNSGWQSITDLQIDAYGLESDYGTRFLDRNGKPISPNIADIASAFGVRGVRLESPKQIQGVIRQGLESRTPTVVELLVAREYPRSAGISDGWWDVPVPAYLTSRRLDYERKLKEVQQ